MFYTSGTTGRPKGVRGALSGSTEIPTEIMSLIASGMNAYVPEAGRSLLVGPVYHSAQWAFTFMPMVSGSTVVMRHKFDPAETVRLIGAEAVTNVHLVPTQFKRMLDVPEAQRAELDATTLAACWHGAAPCPPAWKQAMIDWFGPVVHEYYGSTEGSFISAIRADEWLEKRSSVGKPLETVEVIVVDDEGNRLGVGEEGTLYFRSLMGMDFEYHNAPDKTEAAHLEPGVFTTGDVGLHRRRRLPAPVGPQDRHDHLGRGQHLPRRDRGGHRRTRRRRRRRGHRGPQRRVRRRGQGSRRALRGRRGHPRARRGTAAALPRHASPATSAPASSTSWCRCPAPAPARSSSASCAAPTGKAPAARSRAGVKSVSPTPDVGPLGAAS